MVYRWLSLFTNRVFIKYAVVGVLGTLIDVGVLAALTQMSGINPESDSIFYVFVSIAFVAAVLNNFVLNRWWTFEVRTKKNTKRQFVKFFLVSLIGLFLSNFFMFLFVSLGHIFYIFAKLLTSAVVLVWNFLANKYWTFRTMSMKKMKVEIPQSYAYKYSVIIPAYNEEKRITKTLMAVEDFFKTFKESYEVVVVDDGSQDSTIEVVEAFIKEANAEKYMKVCPVKKNTGKGHAVKEGILEAKGEYILFTDADNSTPFYELKKFHEMKDKGTIFIGSRYLPESNVEIKQPWYRILLGRAANLIIQAFLVDDVKDTQCGFKMFPYAIAKDIFHRMKIDGFGFDMEALAIAEVLGYEIKEVPVSWYNSEDSRVRPVKDAWRTLTDLVYIKLNIWTGKYKL